MSSFLASYHNEWDKLTNRKKYIVFLFICVAICLLWAWLGQVISNFISRQSGITLAIAPTPMSALPFFLQILVPFLMFMGLTDLLTMEESEKSMKAMICRPIERWKLYSAKLLAVVTYAAVCLTCVFIASVTLNQIFGKPLSVSEILIALVSYTLTLAPLAVLTCFAALVAVLGKSGTLTMFLLLLSYILLNSLPVFFPVLNEMLFTSYLNWYRLWIGALPGFSKLLHMLIIVLGYGLVFFMAGSLLFDRKEY